MTKSLSAISIRLPAHAAAPRLSWRVLGFGVEQTFLLLEAASSPEGGVAAAPADGVRGEAGSAR